MRILIACAEGHTAAMLAQRIDYQMGFHGVAATIDTADLVTAQQASSAYDIVLLAPHIAYAKDGIPNSMVMSASDYERKNAKKIANDLLALLGE